MDRRDFLVSAFPNIFEMFDFQNVDINNKTIFRKVFLIILELFEVSGGLKRWMILVWGLGDTFKNPEIIEMKGLRDLQ